VAGSLLVRSRETPEGPIPGGSVSCVRPVKPVVVLNVG